MIYGLGMQELLVILAIAMLLFGGKKLPEVGKNLGKAIRGFKQAEDEATQEIQEAARNAREAETAEPGEEAAAGSEEDSTEKPGEESETEPPGGETEEKPA